MALYRLFVGDTLVYSDDGVDVVNVNGAVCSISSFERNYETPSKLVIRFESDPVDGQAEWRGGPYPADTRVLLWQDDRTVFEGLTRLPRAIFALGNYSGVEYTCFDRCHALYNVPALTTPDVPVGFPPGEREPNIVLPTGNLLKVVTAFLKHVGADIEAKGVNPLPAFSGGCDQIETYPAQVDGMSIERAMRAIAASAPGCRVFLDPTDCSAEDGVPKYRFVNLYNASPYTLALDVNRVSKLEIERSTDGCCGAVKVFGFQTHGRSAGRIKNDVPLFMDPAWDKSLEAKWNQQRGGMKFSLATDAAERVKLGDVFRKFSFKKWIDPNSPDYNPAYAIPDLSTASIGAAVVVNKETDPDTDEILYDYHRVAVESVDVSAGTMLLAEPVITAFTGGFDHFTRPKVNLPDATGLIRSDDGYKGRALMILSESSGATIGFEVNPIRWPLTGFSGRAYELSPVTCGVEHSIAVPGGVNRSSYAKFAQAALSQPHVDGSVPINGDLPADLWLLRRKIRITTPSHGPCPYDTLDAPLMGVEVSWATGAPRGTFKLTDDRASLLAGGHA